MTDDFGGVILLGADGADGSTVVMDESPVSHGVATVSGNAQYDTSQFKYGASSVLFDGTGDDIQWSPSADWYLTEVWTIEFSVCFNATTADQSIMSQWTGIGVGSTGSWMIRTQASGALQFFIFNGSSNDTLINLPTSSYTSGVWYHYALCSNGTETRWHIEGAMVGSDTPSTTTRCGNDILSLVIGRDGLGGRSFNG